MTALLCHFAGKIQEIHGNLAFSDDNRVRAGYLPIRPKIESVYDYLKSGGREGIQYQTESVNKKIKELRTSIIRHKIEKITPLGEDK